MKKKILAVLLTAVCTMGMVAGCGGNTSNNGTAGTQSAASGDSYKIGISQFAEHGSLDNCREGFLEGLKEAGIEKARISLLSIRMHRQIQVQQARSQTASYQVRWI